MGSLWIRKLYLAKPVYSFSLDLNGEMLLKNFNKRFFGSKIVKFSEKYFNSIKLG